METSVSCAENRPHHMRSKDFSRLAGSEWMQRERRDAPVACTANSVATEPTGRSASAMAPTTRDPERMHSVVTGMIR